MIKKSFYLLLLLPVLGLAPPKPIGAGVYSWSTPERNSSLMVFGSANDLSYLEVSANKLKKGKKKKFELPSDQERLILVKSGTLTITLGDSTATLGKGSVAMVMPSGQYAIQNTEKEDCLFHQMTYRSKAPIDASRGQTAGGSFVKDWNKITFREHERGGVRSYFERPTAMAKRFEIHVTTLKGGLSSHPPHTHAAEEIILVLDGKVEMLIGEKSYKGQPGDVLFVPTNLPHGLKNDSESPCSYFAIQWE